MKYEKAVLFAALGFAGLGPVWRQYKATGRHREPEAPVRNSRGRDASDILDMSEISDVI